MRFSTVATAVTLLAAAGNAVAIGQLAFDLGAQGNSDGVCKTTADYVADFDTISSYSTIVRVYAASDCDTLENIGPALEETGFQAFIGVWPTDDTHYAAEKAALSAYLPTIDPSNILAITVGSEALYRGDLTAAELATKIDEIRTLVQAISGYESMPVGTVDSWNILVDGSNVAAIEASDILFANAFSYWQGQTMANSSHSFFDDIMQALQVIQTSKGSTDIEFWIGETGFPTDGGNYGSSYPSVDNAAEFWQEAICGIRGWGVNTIVFEAIDEAWKPATSGVEGVENHWGVWESDSVSPKYDLTCSFS
ncbi:glycoside hydrolase superfamily [Limtongia smithiae]|uniref:glycoside hydrolase superfamily n=1 Tax=Limtongia smithiae TaxID=1125753 RepID=UPI0034CEF61F